MNVIAVAVILSVAATPASSEVVRNSTRTNDNDEQTSVPTLTERSDGSPSSSVIASVLNDGELYKEPALTVDHLPSPEEASRTEDDHSRTYDVLYQQGIDHYLSNDWYKCVEYLQLAIKDYKWYTDTLKSCRRDCRAEAQSATPLAVQRDNSQEFYETAIRNALCLLKCRQRHFASRHHHVASLDVDRDFAIRKPYDYLQLCLFKIGRIQDAADAAVTVLAAQPTHQVMTENLKQYIEHYSADQDVLENLELQEYAREYVRGDHAYSAKDYARSVEHMEAALSLYWRALEDCRLMCEEPFDQGWFPDFVSSVANHFTFTFRCKRKCGPQLANLYGEEIENFLPSILNYLQYGYQKLDQIPKACGAVESYLELLPADAAMLRNKQYYLTNYQKVDRHFVVRKEIAEHAARERYEERLLNFVDTEFVFLEEDRSVIAERLLLQEVNLDEEPEDTSPVAEEDVPDAGLTPRLEVDPLLEKRSAASGREPVADGDRISSADQLASAENFPLSFDKKVSVHQLQLAEQQPSVDQLPSVDQQPSVNQLSAEKIRSTAGPNRAPAAEFHGAVDDDLSKTAEKCLFVEVEDHPTEGEDSSPDGEDSSPDGEDSSPDGEDHSPDGEDSSPNGEDTSPDGEDHSRAGKNYSTDEEDPLPAREDHGTTKTIPRASQDNKMRTGKKPTPRKEPVLSRTAAQLNGTGRYVVDNLISEIKCKILTALIHVAGERGDGYHRNINPHTDAEDFLGLTLSRAGLMVHAGLLEPDLLRLVLQVTTAAKNQLVQHFELHRPLYFSYTHLVCRTAKPEYYDSRIEHDMSHVVHVDNCIMYSPTQCFRRPPAYTFRDYSAILYLNDDFEGGEFVFTTDPRGVDIQSSVEPKCGRMVGFSAGPENPHGVKAVLRGSRCALALWFTHDEKHKDNDRILAETLLDKIKSGEIRVK